MPRPDKRDGDDRQVAVVTVTCECGRDLAEVLMATTAAGEPAAVVAHCPWCDEPTLPRPLPPAARYLFAGVGGRAGDARPPTQVSARSATPGRWLLTVRRL